MITSCRFRQMGFSLVELTVVLLLITLIASVAVRETSELGFQVRYDQTKERLEMIKQAILGNPKQIVNGQQAISGFAADMGRLPGTPRELLQPAACLTATSVLPDIYFECVDPGETWTWFNIPCTDNVSVTQAACEAVPATWLGWRVHTATQMGLGWRGPYLSITSSPNSVDAFTDAWGTTTADDPTTTTFDESTAYYGWRFAPALNPAFLGDGNTANDQNDVSPYPRRLAVQSLGKDQLLNGLPTNDFIDDYPDNVTVNDAGVYFPNPLIETNEWMVDVSGGITVALNKRMSGHGYCGFTGPGTNFTTQTACEDAGGNWSAATCTFGVSSCKGSGGKWKNCLMNPTTCAAVGGSFAVKCEFSEKACKNAGGGSAWSSNTCSVTASDKSDCELKGGVWRQDCALDATACAATPSGGTHAVGTWENTALPNSCSFSLSDCQNIGGKSSDILSGQSTGDECLMSHANFLGSPYTPQTCKSATGNWTARVCLNLFHRENGRLVSRVSLPVSINEDGMSESVQFLLKDTGDIDGDSNTDEPVPGPFFVSTGQNAIGIYEYTDNDGDSIYCEPGSDKFYPVDRPGPIQIDFRPNTTLPVINW
jgi:hypothetical protein